jgi:hypothetical protein
MINKNKKRTLYLCLICVFAINTLKAQSDFREGYIIDLKNDTLFGEINYRGDISMGEVCLFKLKKDGDPTKFEPKDIQGYRFKDDRYFIVKQINNKPVFLEFLIKGKINVYYFRNREGDHYYIEKEIGKLVELPYKESIIYKDENRSIIDNKGGIIRNSKTYAYNSNRHLGVLIYYMQDAPNLVEKIKQLKEPDHESLIEIAKDYHNAICTTESCIIYQRRKKGIKIEIEPAFGTLNYVKADKSVDKFALTGGALAHIWLPRVNEKLYFRTGILYTKTTFDNAEKINLFKIPVQIEYIYPKGQFVPKCAYGLNFYKPFYVTVGAMVGFEAKINQKMAFCLNYDLDFDGFGYLPIIPQSLLAQSILLGLSIKL